MFFFLLEFCCFAVCVFHLLNCQVPMQKSALILPRKCLSHIWEPGAASWHIVGVHLCFLGIACWQGQIWESARQKLGGGFHYRGGSDNTTSPRSYIIPCTWLDEIASFTTSIRTNEKSPKHYEQGARAPMYRHQPRNLVFL